MKPWLFTAALLAGCSGQSTSPGDYDRARFNLIEAAAETERGCDLAEGSLLHVTPRGDLEVRPATQTLTYPQFSCLMAAIEQPKLEKRGVQVILTGEDAAR